MGRGDAVVTPSWPAAMPLLPIRGPGVILRRGLEILQSYERLGNYRFVRVRKRDAEPKDDATLFTWLGFFFPPELVRPLLRRILNETENEYYEAVSPSMIVVSKGRPIPPASLDDHAARAAEFRERYRAAMEGPNRDGPEEWLLHSFANEYMRPMLEELQRSASLRRVDIVAPFLRWKGEGKSRTRILLDGIAGHVDEARQAWTDGRLEEFLLGNSAFGLYAANGTRHLRGYLGCLSSLVDGSLGTVERRPIDALPVTVYLPKDDFLGFTDEDEELILAEYPHPESRIRWMSGGHNRLFLRLAESIGELSRDRIGRTSGRRNGRNGAHHPLYLDGMRALERLEMRVEAARG